MTPGPLFPGKKVGVRDGAPVPRHKLPPTDPFILLLKDAKERYRQEHAQERSAQQSDLGQFGYPIPDSETGGAALVVSENIQTVSRSVELDGTALLCVGLAVAPVLVVAIGGFLFLLGRLP